ncbi:MAG TPA: hypothetical protein VEU47_13265 [Candidatus Cybelea sp.]|nr:hypothetical protein [Candidatus Cybelea sp.]
MLSIEDCLALCELTEDEVAAIAEHRHLPDIVASELGFYLMHCPDGRLAIKAIIRDDIERAAAKRDFVHAAKLKLVLKQFIERHNGAVNAASAVSSVSPPNGL